MRAETSTVRGRGEVGGRVVFAALGGNQRWMEGTTLACKLRDWGGDRRQLFWLELDTGSLGKPAAQGVELDGGGI